MRPTIPALALALTLTGCAYAPTSSPTGTPSADVSRETSTPTPEATAHTYPVERVVDGDTLYVTMDGERVGIRVIGMDTPETVHPTQGVECYGPEASAAAKARLEGQSVTLTQDPTQGTLDAETGHRTDYYGRALYYVGLPDGTDFGLSMIQDGLGQEYTYRSQAYARQAAYRAAEDLARETGEGLWGNC